MSSLKVLAFEVSTRSLEMDFYSVVHNLIFYGACWDSGSYSEATLLDLGIKNLEFQVFVSPLWQRMKSN